MTTDGKRGRTTAFPEPIPAPLGPGEGGNPYSHLGELTVQHDKIIDMLVGKEGHPPCRMSDVARELNVAPAVMTRITQSPMFAKKMRERKAERESNEIVARNFYKDGALAVAAKHLDIIFETKNDSAAIAGIKDWQDRAGLKPELNINLRGSMVTAELSDAEIARHVVKRLLEGGFGQDKILALMAGGSNGDGTDVDEDVVDADAFDIDELDADSTYIEPD